MKLMTKELEALFAKTGRQDIPDPLVIAKLFDPSGSWTYYVTEYYPEDRTIFGWVDGVSDPELGYASLAEIESVKNRFGLGMERDLHFRPCRLSEIKAKKEAVAA